MRHAAVAPGPSTGRSHRSSRPRRHRRRGRAPDRPTPTGHAARGAGARGPDARRRRDRAGGHVRGRRSARSIAASGPRCTSTRSRRCSRRSRRPSARPSIPRRSGPVDQVDRARSGCPISARDLPGEGRRGARRPARRCWRRCCSACRPARWSATSRSTHSAATTSRCPTPTSPRCASWSRTSTRSRTTGRSSAPTCASTSRSTRSCTRRSGRCRGCGSGWCDLATEYVSARTRSTQRPLERSDPPRRHRPVRPVVDPGSSPSIPKSCSARCGPIASTRSSAQARVFHAVLEGYADVVVERVGTG